MSKALEAMKILARQLFVIEAGRTHKVDQHESATRVCEKLRQALTKFAGPVGYASLLSRALSLAKAELPELKLVVVQKDGSMEGWDERNPMLQDQQIRENAGVTLVAQLLGLLVIFIGESLMVTLLRDAWPSESFDPIEPRSEEKS